MRISPKKTLVNLEYITLEGNVLDISIDNSGIIYNLLKMTNQGNFNIDMDVQTYDSVAVFFALGTLNKEQSKKLIEEVHNKTNENAKIYIWDRIKSKNEIIRDKVVASLGMGIKREFYLSNLNPFYEFNIERVEKILSEKFMIVEKVIWDNIIYIEAEKINYIKK
ncbi:MAG: hypothetical protein ACRC57_07690 [Sarcina sp.]